MKGVDRCGLFFYVYNYVNCIFNYKTEHIDKKSAPLPPMTKSFDRHSIYILLVTDITGLIHFTHYHKTIEMLLLDNSIKGHT